MRTEIGGSQCFFGGCLSCTISPVRKAHPTIVPILQLCARELPFDFAAARLRSGRTGEGGSLLCPDLAQTRYYQLSYTKREEFDGNDNCGTPERETLALTRSADSGGDR